jgi:hypothetical protein
MKAAIIAGSVALLLTGAAHADATIPPVEYDNPYRGTWIVVRLPTIEAVKSACNKNRDVLACGGLVGNVCLIHMVSDKVLQSRELTYAMVLRHEIGHCNGWGADHAGARTVKVIKTQPHKLTEEPEASRPSVVDGLIALGQRRLKEMEGK